MVNVVGVLAIFNFVTQGGKEQTVGDVEAIRWIGYLYD
jgi:hypothetical protein